MLNQTENNKTENLQKTKNVPKWKNDDGTLIKLGRKDFPYSIAGNLAYCDFRIAYWQQKKQEILKKHDPQTKIQKKKERLEAQLAEINAKLEAMSK